MDNRATNAMWLVPLAYVVVDRLLGFVIWQLIVVSGETSVMTPGFSIVLSIATALAAACVCVYGHYRLVGPLPVKRAFVMAAIALPLFVIGAIVTTGLANFVRYFTLVPAQAALHYVVGFFALPLAALILGPRQAAPVEAAPVVDAPRPPSSTASVLLRVAAALLSAGLFLGGIFFVTLILAFGGSHMSSEDYGFLFGALVAVAIFGFCFLCAVGVFRRFLKIGRAVVAASAVPFAAYALVEGGEEGVLAVVGIGVYVALFWAMCRSMEPSA